MGGDYHHSIHRRERPWYNYTRWTILISNSLQQSNK
jgi:hypothetical protein